MFVSLLVFFFLPLHSVAPSLTLVAWGTNFLRFLVATGESRSASGARQFESDVWAFDMATNTWSELISTSVGSTLMERRYGSAGGISLEGDMSVETRPP